MKIFLQTYGCQMNEYDSQLVESILTQAGYHFVQEEDEADIILLNTCSVRDTAQRKVLGNVDFLRHQLRDKDVLIGILGCMATHLQDKLFRRKGGRIDFACGPDSYRRLPDIITQARNETPVADVALSSEENYDGICPSQNFFDGNPSALPQVDFSHPRKVNAWIAISRGCNNFCTFCVVPYARGRERSRSAQGILDETKALVDQGFSQVTLLGQNVNSYHCDDYDFPQLLTAVSRVQGIRRVRFMSPHPKDFPDALIHSIEQNPTICKHIHLPLQSANNRILKLMNRTYTKDKFLQLVEDIRRAIPQIALTTDIIVGFPTETEDDFNDTLDVIRAIRFDAAFIFKYSPRQGTAAQKNFKDDVLPAIKTQRIVALNKIQKQISLEKNQDCVGRRETILIEDVGQNNTCRGRTDSHKMVSVKANCAIGDFIDVRIVHASYFGLDAELA